MLKALSLMPHRTRHAHVILTVFAVLVISLTTSALMAQTDTGSIAGTVADPTGAVIPGATIVATNTGTGQKLTAVSDGIGDFKILAVPRGDYNVVASMPGFKSDSVTVSIALTQTQNVAKGHEGNGLLSRVTSIQRLETKGGVAPAGGCDATHKGQETGVHYAAIYLFYAGS
jgi:hypothetical protein